ncbi:hypothetical protein FMUND_13509 [Fusarium mundagurra]|uniref:Uncharacterized protein n=1 Tax=Fusarium mundagurra TaxID=1567541 RepID=A0A8H5Y027_9HYPO|nr:hypothetical protein FMUND_13509 [Fusarium mundagurra]
MAFHARNRSRITRARRSSGTNNTTAKLNSRSIGDDDEDGDGVLSQERPQYTPLTEIATRKACFNSAALFFFHRATRPPDLFFHEGHNVMIITAPKRAVRGPKRPGQGGNTSLSRTDGGIELATIRASDDDTPGELDLFIQRERNVQQGACRSLALGIADGSRQGNLR